MKKVLITFTLILVATFLIDGDAFAQGCSMCKLNSKNAAESNNMAAGLNAGILYLMVIPYILLFFLFRKKIIGFIKEFRAINKTSS